MKRQKVHILVRRAMNETAFGSTERDDAIDKVQATFCLSSAQLNAQCRSGVRVDYWNR